MSAIASLEEKWKGLSKPQRIGVAVGGVGAGVFIAYKRRRGSATAGAPTAAVRPSNGAHDILGGSGGGLGGGGLSSGGSESSAGGSLAGGGLAGGSVQSLAGVAGPGSLGTPENPYIGVAAAPTTVSTLSRMNPTPVADSFGLPYGSSGYFGNGGAGSEGGIWGTLGYAQPVIDSGGTLKVAVPQGTTNAFLADIYGQASPAQRSSKEYIDTLNSLNKESGLSARYTVEAVRPPDAVSPPAYPVIGPQYTSPPAYAYEPPSYATDSNPADNVPLTSTNTGSLFDPTIIAGNGAGPETKPIVSNAPPPPTSSGPTYRGAY